MKKPGILGPLPQAGAPSSGRHEPRSFSSPCNHHVNTFRTIADRQLPPRPTQASPRESHGWDLLHGSNPYSNYPRRRRRTPPSHLIIIQSSTTAWRGATMSATSEMAVRRSRRAIKPPQRPTSPGHVVNNLQHRCKHRNHKRQTANENQQYWPINENLIKEQQMTFFL